MGEDEDVVEVADMVGDAPMGGDVDENNFTKHSKPESNVEKTCVTFNSSVKHLQKIQKTC